MRRDVGLFIVIILIRKLLLVDQTILKVRPIVCTKWIITLFASIPSPVYSEFVFYSIVFCVFLVKVWVYNVPHSVGAVKAEANVCSVRFHPASRYYIAFGCAGNVV